MLFNIINMFPKHVKIGCSHQATRLPGSHLSQAYSTNFPKFQKRFGQPFLTFFNSQFNTSNKPYFLSFVSFIEFETVLPITDLYLLLITQLKLTNTF